MTYIDRYYKRLFSLKNEMQYSDADFAGKLRGEMEESSFQYNVTNSQITNWTGCGAKKTFPPIEAAPFVAKVLHTSIGYLCGLHDVREIVLERTSVNIDIDACNEEYRKTHLGRTLSLDGVLSYQWIKSYQSGRFSRLGPVLSLSETLGWDVDYILGLTDAKNWIQYCLENELYSYIPHGTVFCLTAPENEFAMLDEGNTLARTLSGETVPVKDLASRNPKLLVRYETV